MGENSTAYSYLRPRHRGFRRVIVLSLLVHIVAVGAYALASSKRRPTIDLSERAIVTKLVRLGKKRDQKLLPRKVAAPAAKPDEKLLASKDHVETAPEKRDVDKEKQRALDKIREDAERRRARDEALARIAERVGDDEQEGDPNGSRHGTETQAAQMSLAQAYYGQVHDRIKDFYSVPTIISEGERRTLSAVIIIYIGPDGTILRHGFEKTSGNDGFDRALEAALTRASPLPAPPAFLRETARDGIGLRFRP